MSHDDPIDFRVGGRLADRASDREPLLGREGFGAFPQDVGDAQVGVLRGIAGRVPGADIVQYVLDPHAPVGHIRDRATCGHESDAR